MTVPEPNLNAAPEGAKSAAQLAEDAARSARRLGGGRLVVGMAAIVLLTILVRLPNLTFPMGQSAGMAAYVGRRWMAGDVPYRDAWDNQGPALYLMAGLVTRLIGISPAANRLAMMAMDVATLFLLYGLVRQWCNRAEAMAAGGLFGFFSGALLIQGDCLASGPPMNLLYTLAFLALLRSEGSKLRWLALCGFSMGLAFCFRLVAWVYLAAALLGTVASNRGRKSRAARWGLRPIVLVASAAVAPAGFALYFAHQHALADLWNSVVIYNWLFCWPLGRRELLSHRLDVLWTLAREQAALWLFAGAWIIHAFSVGFRRETRLVATWCVVALLGALAARTVELEDFVQTIPPLAVAAALAVTNPSERLLHRNAQGRLETSSGMLIAFAVVLALGFFYVEARILRFRATSKVVTTDWAAYQVGRLLYKNTQPGERVYEWGSRPQVYVYAQRAAASRFFYNWPLNDPHRVSEFFEPFLQPDLFAHLVQTLTAAPPAFVVTTEDYVEGEVDARRFGPMAPWFTFLRQHYTVWQKVEAKPYSYTILVRKGRAIIAR